MKRNSGIVKFDFSKNFSLGAINYVNRRNLPYHKNNMFSPIYIYIVCLINSQINGRLVVPGKAVLRAKPKRWH